MSTAIIFFSPVLPLYRCRIQLPRISMPKRCPENNFFWLENRFLCISRAWICVLSMAWETVQGDSLVSCNFFIFVFCSSCLTEEVVERSLVVFKAQCSEIWAEHVCIPWVMHTSAHTACLQWTPVASRFAGKVFHTFVSWRASVPKAALTRRESSKIPVIHVRLQD